MVAKTKIKKIVTFSSKASFEEGTCSKCGEQSNEILADSNFCKNCINDIMEQVIYRISLKRKHETTPEFETGTCSCCSKESKEIVKETGMCRDCRDVIFELIFFSTEILDEVNKPKSM